ncbi:MAG: molybdopterin-dependent oxidoreductase [Roseivirga sp.]|nr:molybdopterin-dependent oxidoreductase [Roseivirga sp.]
MSTKQHFRTCNLCEAMCGIVIEHNGKSVETIKGDKEDPFSKGFICPKAVALQDIYEDPDRLKKPIRRQGDEWGEISWKEAFDTVVSKLQSIGKEYGPDAVGYYQGNPSVHNLGTLFFAGSFFRTLQTKNGYSATSLDQLPHHYASQFMLGHYLLMPVPDIDRTQYFLVIGANPIASNGSMMSAAGMPGRIRALQKRNGKMVVIDPRRSETALKADRHHFIKPGTDVYLLAALLQVLFKEALIDIKRVGNWSKGLDQLPSLFEPYTPELASAHTGIEVEEIRTMAHEFAAAESAVCYSRMGASTQAHGTLCQWLTNLINIVTGNFDRPGGAMFSTPAVDVVKGRKNKGTQHKYNRYQSRVRGLPEFNDELPVAALAEEILTEGEGQIKAMVISAGNPVLSSPNGTKLEKALDQLDFMVSIDIYLNETSKHADIILPPQTGLESEHFDVVFNNLAVRDTAKYSEPLFDGAEGSKADWQIFKELTKRMKPLSTEEEALDAYMTPSNFLNEALKKGPHDLNLKSLKAHPHGIDLGPLKPQLPDRLFTEDKMVDLAPALFVTHLKNLSHELPKASSLTLVGRRHLRSNNSWMHNSERLVKGPWRCTILMHPEDARQRALQPETIVRVSSAKGSVNLPLEISDEMMPGVVSIPHGFGHNRNGTRWQVAEAHAGVSINDLTDENLLDGISGNTAFSGVEVEVSASA